MELYYPELLRNKEAFPANIHFSFYERFSTKASELRDQVHLYMPEQFGQPNPVSWDSSFRGGQAIIGAMGGVASAVGSLSSGKFGSMLKGAGQKMTELSRYTRRSNF